MKTKIHYIIVAIILISILFIGSCDFNSNHSNKKNQPKDTLFDFSKYMVENSSEKIELISITRNINKDSLKLILIEYLDKKEKDTLDNKTEIIINNISSKFKIPRYKIASSILDYKFSNDY